MHFSEPGVVSNGGDRKPLRNGKDLCYVRHKPMTVSSNNVSKAVDILRERV